MAVSSPYLAVVSLLLLLFSALNAAVQTLSSAEQANLPQSDVSAPLGSRLENFPVSISENRSERRNTAAERSGFSNADSNTDFDANQVLQTTRFRHYGPMGVQGGIRRTIEYPTPFGIVRRTRVREWRRPFFGY